MKNLNCIIPAVVIALASSSAHAVSLNFNLTLPYQTLTTCKQLGKSTCIFTISRILLKDSQTISLEVTLAQTTVTGDHEMAGLEVSTLNTYQNAEGVNSVALQVAEGGFVTFFSSTVASDLETLKKIEECGQKHNLGLAQFMSIIAVPGGETKIVCSAQNLAPT